MNVGSIINQLDHVHSRVLLFYINVLEKIPSFHFQNTTNIGIIQEEKGI